MHYGDNKPKYVRYGIYSVIILIAFALQSTSVAFPEIFGARAFLLVCVAVSIAMHEREIPAAIFGAVCGILADTAAGLEGFNALVLTILCAVCSILISHLMQNNIVTAFVLSAGATVVYEVLYVIVNYCVSIGVVPWRQIFTFYLPSFVYTLIFVPVFYYIIKKVFTAYKTEQ